MWELQWIKEWVLLFFCVCVFKTRSEIRLSFSYFLWGFVVFSCIIQVLFSCFLWGYKFLPVHLGFISFKYKLSFFLCRSQRRVMFLKNDYFYTVINETPFRLVYCSCKQVTTNAYCWKWKKYYEYEKCLWMKILPELIYF